MRQIGGLPFIDFLAPGLIMMATTRMPSPTHFGISLICDLIEGPGNIVDVLMPPLSAGGAHRLCPGRRDCPWRSGGQCVGMLCAPSPRADA